MFLCGVSGEAVEGAAVADMAIEGQGVAECPSQGVRVEDPVYLYILCDTCGFEHMVTLVLHGVYLTWAGDSTTGGGEYPQGSGGGEPCGHEGCP